MGGFHLSISPPCLATIKVPALHFDFIEKSVMNPLQIQPDFHYTGSAVHFFFTATTWGICISSICPPQTGTFKSKNFVATFILDYTLLHYVTLHCQV